MVALHLQGADLKSNQVIFTQVKFLLFFFKVSVERMCGMSCKTCKIYHEASLCRVNVKQMPCLISCFSLFVF